MTFTSSDILLLQAARHKADLRSIIAYVDYLNHAIITFEEFHSGTNKLLSVGLIAEDHLVLKTSKPFNAWWKKKFSNVKNVYPDKEFQAIKEYLTNNFGESAPIEESMISKISKEDFANATDSYLNKQ